MRQLNGWGRARQGAGVVLGLIAAAVLVGCGERGGGGADAETLVVYCAHDSLYADDVLRAFEAASGIDVRVKYDSEATKSLGLTELIIREAEHPQCDVLWNNQLLGTADLAERGLLEPYMGPGWQRIPANMKDPEGRYAGFGARLRVWVVNTTAMEPTQEAITAILAGDDWSGVTIADPLFGTTLTHYSVLHDVLGEAGLKAWHASFTDRGGLRQGGNATTMNLVAAGTMKLGMTDTDDAFVGLDQGKSIAMAPVLLASGQTIAIPNTVAIVRGTENREAAEKLADYLLSAEAEVMLARSQSRQVPVGEVGADLEATLPEEVKALRPLVAKGYPLSGLVDDREAVLAWLRGGDGS